MKKTILISGTSRGLGLALVEKYLQEGYIVYAGARNPKKEELLALQNTYGEDLHILSMDINSTESVKAAAVAFAKTSSHLDLIINNAATSDREAALPIEEMNVDNCLPVYNTNCLGALRVTQAFLDVEGLSVITNISSEAGSMTNCHRDAGMDYGISKAALNMASVLVQRRIKPKGIKVLSMHPGWVQTRPSPPAPKADFTSPEAAGKIFLAINRYVGTTDGPVFVDNNGDAMEY
jgi:NAD(P)-dependent dehydrogenase (short-subunit alcohol dehydrogenase family)